MKPIKLFTLGFSFLFLSSLLLAQDQPLTPTEKAQMLKTIKDIKGNVKKGRFGVHASAISAFRAASSSPISAYEFYLKCYKEINFTRKGAKESEYRDWKSKNKDNLSSREHSTARRLQLQFLVLTLRAAQIPEDKSKESLVPELTTLMDNCLSAYPYLGKSKRILSSGATGSTFAEVYDLQSTLTALRNWPRAPMDISGIYESTIFPIYRRPERVKELTAAWDKRISQEITLVAATDSTEAEINFTNKTLPKLKWAKYLDLLRAGKKRVALTAMVSLVKSNPDHQDIDAWLEELEGYLSGEVEPSSFEDAAKEAEALAARKKQNGGTNSPARSNRNDAQKALEGLNLGGRRGNREIPKDVDVDRIRELFNRR
ncbi:hypothetical protein OAL09_02885 [Verrucomicrobia bacterium]|jgi:hypothetical protein|nr:hypothetical protein [Verrucomicrobiota bacterium]